MTDSYHPLVTLVKISLVPLYQQEVFAAYEWSVSWFLGEVLYQTQPEETLLLLD